jgi:tRNA U34 5-carboxymethylaminomethyl modifying GTPase MnmE/TrmE
MAMTAAAPPEANASTLHARLVTPPGVGAIAIIAIEGETSRLDALLENLVGAPPPRPGALAWRRFADVDDGVVARIDARRAWLTPHGGRRIVERLRDLLVAAGATWTRAEGDDPVDRHPEAADRFEAEALVAISAAASPLAIPLLLDQPRRWRARAASGKDAPNFTDEDRGRWRRLDRLIDPPRVCVVGAPNAGKSTLANALAGRDVSIASPIAGTTRDFVSARIDLAGLVVEWIDLPGFPECADAAPAGLEASDRAAFEHAARTAATADLLVMLAAPDQAWAALPEGFAGETIRAMSKVDLPAAAQSPRRQDADRLVSAVTGEGVSDLVACVRDTLVPPGDRRHRGPWRWTLPSSPDRHRSTR